MNLKILGAILIVSGCGAVGMMIASSHARQERLLRQLISVYDYMECELQYRLTPLPELCRNAAQQACGALQHFFLLLSTELEDQISPDVERCVTAAVTKSSDLPKLISDSLLLLGTTLGRFDLDGQVRGLEAVRQECRQTLSGLSLNRTIRLRSYQTLGLCAGAALVILFI